MIYDILLKRLGPDEPVKLPASFLIHSWGTRRDQITGAFCYERNNPLHRKSETNLGEPLSPCIKKRRKEEEEEEEKEEEKGGGEKEKR
jgi:hypothetical protein